ncbi:hypothetical protein HYDPIDRAFT_127842 [Hydnomerulius pinastri MD-312]|nr:hypothetical protein HYDPIDRAFT_127842 [Hydnomerulius pinastri MD-312]
MLKGLVINEDVATEDDATLTNVVNGLNSYESDSDMEDDTTDEEDPRSPWYPYGSKVTFLLDMLDNLPRLRLSTDHMSFIIWMLRQLKVSNVPSLKSLRKTQKQLTKALSIPTRMKESPRGHIFYQNGLAELIALDWANPQTRPHIETYPVQSKSVSESFQAEKIVRELGPNLRDPMWADGNKHYYIGELAELEEGQLTIPTRWFRKERNGPVYAEGIPVTNDPTQNVNIVHTDRSPLTFPAVDLKSNWYDLHDRELTVPFSAPQAEHIYEGLNPLREVAQGRCMYTCYVKPWGDDVSGNRSKQYNEHTNIYFAHANIRHEKLSQEYYVRFCSTSPHASAGEQFDTMVADNIT